jgi:hypothetical protein
MPLYPLVLVKEGLPNISLYFIFIEVNRVLYNLKDASKPGEIV